MRLSLIHILGLDINKFKLRAGVFGAEPWSEEMRKRSLRHS